MNKKVVFLALFLLVGSLVLGATPVLALGNPQIISIQPPSGSPVGSNVCIRVKIEWDNEYRAMRIRFGNEGWQESSETEFERCFGTGHLSPGNYTIRVEADRKDGNWSSPAVAEQSYQLTGSPPAPPTNTPAPSGPSRGPNISVFEFSPANGATVGENVDIHIRVDSSNPGATKLNVSCGGVSKNETSEADFHSTWYTDGCPGGLAKVDVYSRAVDDPDWANPSSTSKTYNLSLPPSYKAPTVNFWADSESVKPGQCTYLHWTTSDANSVDIDGISVETSGEKRVCPTVTTKYTLTAQGQGGTANRNITIVVTSQPTTQSTERPTTKPFTYTPTLNENPQNTATSAFSTTHAFTPTPQSQGKTCFEGSYIDIQNGHHLVVFRTVKENAGHADWEITKKPWAVEMAELLRGEAVVSGPANSIGEVQATFPWKEFLPWNWFFGPSDFTICKR